MADFDQALTALIPINAINHNDAKSNIGVGWAMGVTSDQVIAASTDAVISMTRETDTRSMCGFCPPDAALTTTNAYTDLEFSLYVDGFTGSVRPYESGGAKTSTTSVVGDAFSIHRDGTTGAVVYKKNGVTWYTSLATSTASHSVGASAYVTDDTVNTVALSVGGGATEAVTWKYLEDAVVFDGSEHTASKATISIGRPLRINSILAAMSLNGANLSYWNLTSTANSQGGKSDQVIPADTACEVWTEALNTSGAAFIGLIPSGNTPTNYPTLTHSLYRTGANFYVFEGASNRYGPFGISAGDVFKLKRTSGGDVTYYVNDVLKYTSAVSSTVEVCVGTSFFTYTSCTMYRIQVINDTADIEPVTWSYLGAAVTETEDEATDPATLPSITALYLGLSTLKDIEAFIDLAPSIVKSLFRTITSSLGAAASLATEVTLSGVEQVINAAITATSSVTTTLSRVQAITATVSTAVTVATLKTLTSIITAALSLTTTFDKVLNKALAAAISTASTFARGLTLSKTASLSMSSGVIKAITQTLKYAQLRANYPIYNNLYPRKGGSWSANATSLDVVPANTLGVASTTVDALSWNFYGFVEEGVEPTSWTQISFGVNIADNGTTLNVYESSVLRYSTTTTPGDVVSIYRTAGGSISYYENNTLLYSSGYSYTGSIEVAAAIYNRKSAYTVNKATLLTGDGYAVPVTWSYLDDVNVTPVPDTTVTGPSIFTSFSIRRSLTTGMSIAASFLNRQGRNITAALSLTPSLATLRETIQQSLSAAISLTAVSIKAISMSIGASLSQTASVVKAFPYSLSAALSLVPSLLVTIGKPLSAAISMAPALSTIRALLKSLSVSITGAAAFAKQPIFLKALTTAITTSVSMVTAARIYLEEVLLSASIATTSSISFVKTLRRTITASMATSPTILSVRTLLNSLSTGISAAATVSINYGLVLIAAISTSATVSTLRSFAQTITAALSLTGSVIRRVGHTMTASVATGFSASMLRDIALIRTPTISLTPIITPLQQFYTQVLTAALSVTAASIVTVVGLGRSLTAGITATPSFLRAITMDLPTTLSLSAGFARNIFKTLLPPLRFTVVMTPLQEFYTQVMTAAMSLNAASITTIQGLGRSLTTGISASASFTRSITHTLVTGITATAAEGLRNYVLHPIASITLTPTMLALKMFNIKALTASMTMTAASIVTVVGFGQSLIAGITLTPALSMLKALRQSLTTIITTTVTNTKNFPYHLDAVLTMTGTVVRRIPRILTAATITLTVTLLRSFPRTLTATILTTAAIVTVFGEYVLTGVLNATTSLSTGILQASTSLKNGVLAGGATIRRTVLSGVATLKSTLGKE